MKKSLISILCLGSIVVLSACDPAFVRSIEVANPTPVTQAPFPLSDIHALAGSFGFAQTAPPSGSRDALESEGYELVVHYERSQPDSSHTESLSISRAPDGLSHRLDLFAFVALGEPENLGNFRDALTSLLCENGYSVEDAEDCAD